MWMQQIGGRKGIQGKRDGRVCYFGDRVDEGG